jgi:hypothetical protein
MRRRQAGQFLLRIGCGLAVLCWSATAAPAQSGDTQSQLNECQGDLWNAKVEKEQVLDDLRSGLFCSKCNRSRTELDRTGGFSRHLGEVQGEAVPAPPNVVTQRTQDLNRKIETIASRCQNLADRIDDERQAALRQQQAEAERQRAAAAEQWRENARRQQEAQAAADERARQAQQAEFDARQRQYQAMVAQQQAVQRAAEQQAQQLEQGLRQMFQQQEEQQRLAADLAEQSEEADRQVDDEVDEFRDEVRRLVDDRDATEHAAAADRVADASAGIGRLLDELDEPEMPAPDVPPEDGLGAQAALQRAREAVDSAGEYREDGRDRFGDYAAEKHEQFKQFADSVNEFTRPGVAYVEETFTDIGQQIALDAGGEALQTAGDYLEDRFYRIQRGEGDIPDTVWNRLRARVPDAALNSAGEALKDAAKGAFVDVFWKGADYATERGLEQSLGRQPTDVEMWFATSETRMRSYLASILIEGPQGAASRMMDKISEGMDLIMRDDSGSRSRFLGAEELR